MDKLAYEQSFSANASDMVVGGESDDDQVESFPVYRGRTNPHAQPCSPVQTLITDSDSDLEYDPPARSVSDALDSRQHMQDTVSNTEISLLHTMAASAAESITTLKEDVQKTTGQQEESSRKINNLTARLSSLEEKVTQLLQPALTRRRAVRNLLRVICVVCREHPHLDKARLADSCCSTMVCSTCLDVWSASAARDIANDIDIAAGLPCPACRVSVPKASFICLPQWPALASSLKELASNDDFC